MERLITEVGRTVVDRTVRLGEHVAETANTMKGARVVILTDPAATSTAIAKTVTARARTT
jgi:hypothetical protein